jgi:hypothetical protein
LVLLAFADVSMFQFLPWKKNEFFDLSQGYPTMTIMKVCLTTKTVQSIVSVSCEISYLLMSSSLDDSSVDGQAKALFILNIAMGAGTIIMDVLMLCLRGEVLRKAAAEKPGRRASEMELSDLYSTHHNRDGEAIGIGHDDPIPRTSMENPMHATNTDDDTQEKQQQQQGGDCVGDGPSQLRDSCLSQEIQL